MKHFFTKRYVKIPVTALVGVVLLLQFIPFAEPARAGLIDDAMNWLQEKLSKIQIPEIALTEKGDIKLGSWTLTGCISENDRGECINPFSVLTLRNLHGKEIKSQTTLVSEDGQLLVPRPSLPSQCELRIPLPDEEEEMTPEQKLAQRRACTHLRRLQKSAAQEVYLAKKIFNSTDPFTECLFLRNCRTSCGLRLGTIIYNITVIDIANMFLPTGIVTIVQKVLNVGKIIMEVKTVIAEIKALAKDGIAFVENIINVFQQIQSFFASFANLGLKFSDALIYAGGALTSSYIGGELREIGIGKDGKVGWLIEKGGDVLTAGDGLVGGAAATAVLNTDRAKQGFNSMKQLLYDFAENNIKFSTAKSEALNLTAQIQGDIEAVKSRFKQEKEIDFLFNPNLQKRKDLDKTIEDYFLVFESIDAFLGEILEAGTLKDGRSVTGWAVGEGREEWDNLPDAIPIELRKYFCTSLPLELPINGTLACYDPATHPFFKNCFIPDRVIPHTECAFPCRTPAYPLWPHEDCAKPASQNRCVNDLGFHCYYDDCDWLEAFKNVLGQVKGMKEFLDPEYILDVVERALGGSYKHPEKDVYVYKEEKLNHEKDAWRIYWESLARIIVSPKWVDCVIARYEMETRHALMMSACVNGVNPLDVCVALVDDIEDKNNIKGVPSLQWIEEIETACDFHMTNPNEGGDNGPRGWVQWRVDEYTRERDESGLPQLAELTEDDLEDIENIIDNQLTYYNWLLEETKRIYDNLPEHKKHPLKTRENTYFKGVFWCGGVPSEQEIGDRYFDKSYDSDIAYHNWDDRIEIIKKARDSFPHLLQALEWKISPQDPLLIYRIREKEEGIVAILEDFEAVIQRTAEGVVAELKQMLRDDASKYCVEVEEINNACSMDFFDLIEPDYIRSRLFNEQLNCYQTTGDCEIDVKNRNHKWRIYWEDLVQTEDIMGSEWWEDWKATRMNPDHPLSLTMVARHKELRKICGEAMPALRKISAIESIMNSENRGWEPRTREMINKQIDAFEEEMGKGGESCLYKFYCLYPERNDFEQYKKDKINTGCLTGEELDTYHDYCEYYKLHKDYEENKCPQCRQICSDEYSDVCLPDCRDKCRGEGSRYKRCTNGCSNDLTDCYTGCSTDCDCGNADDYSQCYWDCMSPCNEECRRVYMGCYPGCWSLFNECYGWTDDSGTRHPGCSDECYGDYSSCWYDCAAEPPNSIDDCAAGTIAHACWCQSEYWSLYDAEFRRLNDECCGYKGYLAYLDEMFSLSAESAIRDFRDAFKALEDALRHLQDIWARPPPADEHKESAVAKDYLQRIIDTITTSIDIVKPSGGGVLYDIERTMGLKELDGLTSYVERACCLIRREWQSPGRYTLSEYCSRQLPVDACNVLIGTFSDEDDEGYIHIVDEGVLRQLQHEFETFKEEIIDMIKSKIGEYKVKLWERLENYTEEELCPQNIDDLGFLDRTTCFEKRNERFFRQLPDFLDVLSNLETIAFALPDVEEAVVGLKPEFRMEPVQIRGDLIEQVEDKTKCWLKNNVPGVSEIGDWLSGDGDVEDDCDQNKKISVYEGQRTGEGNYEHFRDNILNNPLSSIEHHFDFIRKTTNDYINPSCDGALDGIRQWYVFGADARRIDYNNALQGIKDEVDFLWRDLIWGRDEELRDACAVTALVLDNNPSEIEQACKDRDTDTDTDTDTDDTSLLGNIGLKNTCQVLADTDLDLLEDPETLISELNSLRERRACITVEHCDDGSKPCITCPEWFCTSPDAPLQWTPCNDASCPDPYCKEKRDQGAGGGFYNNIVWDVSLSISQRQWPPDTKCPDGTGFAHKHLGAKDLCIQTQERMKALESFKENLEDLTGIDIVEVVALPEGDEKEQKIAIIKRELNKKITDCNELYRQQELKNMCDEFYNLRKAFECTDLGFCREAQATHDKIKQFCLTDDASEEFKCGEGLLRAGSEPGIDFTFNKESPFDGGGIFTSEEEKEQKRIDKVKAAREARIKAVTLCSDAFHDIRTPLNEIMKVFSVLLGIRSYTGAKQGLGGSWKVWDKNSGIRKEARMLYERASQMIDMIKGIPDMIGAKWEEKDAGGTSWEVSPVECISNPMVSYTAAGIKRSGPKGGPVCPNVDTLFQELDAQFGQIRHSLRQIDLTRKDTSGWTLEQGRLKATFLDLYPIDTELNEYVRPIYEQAEAIKEKSQLLWALATAINFANENCTCGQSYCKMIWKIPFCISGLPLTITPIKEPYCMLVWTLRYALGSLAEKLHQDLEQEFGAPPEELYRGVGVSP